MTGWHPPKASRAWPGAGRTAGLPLSSRGVRQLSPIVRVLCGVAGRCYPDASWRLSVRLLPLPVVTLAERTANPADRSPWLHRCETMLIWLPVITFISMVTVTEVWIIAA
jgi:hypothetical protein